MAKEVTNGLKPDQTKVATEILARVENIRSETASKQGEFMAFCKEQKKAEKEVLGEAKAAGLSAKALKMVLKDREYARKRDALADGLDIDDQSQFELLQEKLGGLADLPLGKAAVAAAKAKPVGDSKNTATVN